MGITAIAVVVGGGAIAAGVAIEVVAAVALTATVVGMVTKSPVLMKVGAGLGLASAGAGLIAEGSNAGASAAAEATAPSAAESAAPATSAIAPVAGANAAVDTVDVTAPALSGANTANNVVAGTTSLASTANTAAQSPVSQVKADVGTGTPLDINLQAPDIKTPSSLSMPEIKSPDSFISNMLQGIEDHKALATASAQLIGGGLSGLGTTYAADQQHDINQQLLDLQKKKLANGSAQPSINPQYNGTANLYPTTTPVYSGTQAAGIINQQRSK